MAAGVEIVEIPGQSRHPPQIVRQHFGGKGSGLAVGGAQVHGIGTVSHQLSEASFQKHFSRSGGIGRILRLCPAASGIPGEKGKGIGPDGAGGFHHFHISPGGRQMTSQIQQVHPSFSPYYSISFGKMQIIPFHPGKNVL